ncbi:carboxypeptidase D [Entomortierella parvispora]|uniref:Carboxypeptidase n=1 Tax=Entomortierella parvispora TaxID=205924 RepID=A0A9P3H8R1_9FUNG|nr:carboxypeptidase D [Entomortierella parvispora]
MRASSMAWLTIVAIGQILMSINYVQAQTQEDYIVKDLPGLSPADSENLKQYAGHMALDEGKLSNLFFWLVTKKRDQKSGKLIIWLNGGPGCSSADGYFLESGPLRFVDQTLTINKGGWHEFANVVFLDQPVGTGLSFTKDQLLGSMEEITNHFLAFLREFFKIFPDLAQDDLYLAGESYAGTYIPYFAKGILDHNENLPEGHHAYNMQGMAIGNGWIDPLHQYTSFIPFVQKYGIGTPDLISDLTHQQDRCLDDIRLQDLISQNKCEDLVSIILRSSITGNETNPMCINEYDIRRKEVYPGCGTLWPYELPQMKEYLNRQDVRRALNAIRAPDPWGECSRRVSDALRFDDSTPAISLLPGILEKTKILLFSGQQDLICNHIGTEFMISNMTWQGAQGFVDSPTHKWTVEDIPAGEWIEDRNLTYVLVFNSSHMVPYDVPLVALDMMNRFMGLDPRLQNFKSHLDTDTDSDTSDTLPPGGEKIDIDQPGGSHSSNGSALLLLVLVAIGCAVFVMLRRRNRQKKLGGEHTGVQWFPLSNSNNDSRSRGQPISTDELDELVVESGIHDSDEDNFGDDDDDEDHRRHSGERY